MCLIVLFFWVSFQYARVLVWEIWDPKFSESTSQLLDSLCYCLHYCRKIFSVLRKRLFSLLKLIICLRCQACFFFHATAAQEKAICQARSSSLPPLIYVGEEVREKAERKKIEKKQKTIFFIGHDSDFFDKGPHFYSDLARGFSCSSRPLLPTRGVFWQKHIVTSCLATSWRK